MIKKKYLDWKKNYPNNFFYSSWASTLMLYIFIIFYCHIQYMEKLQGLAGKPYIYGWAHTHGATNSYDREYNKIWVLLLTALTICLILFLIAYFFSFSTIKDSEKLSEYECGFEPFDNATRHPFDVHFYIVGILFLIFDVEIALLFPWVLSLYAINWFSFYIMIIFLTLLTIGFFYEWHRGALVWPHQQYSTVFTDYKEN